MFVLFVYIINFPDNLLNLIFAILYNSRCITTFKLYRRDQTRLFFLTFSQRYEADIQL